MKINWLSTILFIALVICLALMVRNCREPSNDYEINELKRQLEEQDGQLKIKDEALKEVKLEYEEKVAELSGAIDSANTIIENTNLESEARLKELEKKDSELTDYKLKYENMTLQRDEWKSRFSLVGKEKDDIISAQAREIKIEVELRIATELVLENYRSGLKTRDDLISELEKKLFRKERSRTLERLAFVTVSSLLLYKAIK